MKAAGRILYLIILLILFPFPAPVNAKGKHVNMDNTKTSSVVVIGDSRICNLAKRVRSYGESREKYSFNATGAGHYIYRKKWVSGKWKNKNLVISSPKYLKEQMTLVRRALKRHGKCTIILEATINDVHKSYVSFEKESLESILKLRKELLGVKVKYKGQVRTPNFRVTSVIPPVRNDKRVIRFNATLKRQFGGHYIDLGLNKTWKGYYKDRLHLKKKGSDKLYNILDKALRNPEH